MSQENLDGIADVLEELASMKQDDPEGYAAVVQDLREEQASEAPAREHAERLLDQIQAGRDAASAPLIALLQQAYKDQAASEAGGDQQ